MEAIFCRSYGIGRPIILLHGFCETHEIWNDFAPEIAAIGCQVFTPDLPGFGKSLLPQTPFSIADIGRILAEWVTEIGLRQPVLIGHSLGGYVALAMAAERATTYSGIGLFHSTAWPDTDERKTTRNKVIEFVRQHGVTPYIETFVPGLFYDKNHPAIPFVMNLGLKTSEDTLTAYLSAMRDRHSSIEFLLSYQRPLLIIGGDSDAIVSESTSEDLFRKAPYGFLSILVKTAHMGMFESKMNAIETIRKFIEIVDRGMGKEKGQF